MRCVFKMGIVAGLLVMAALWTLVPSLEAKKFGTPDAGVCFPRSWLLCRKDADCVRVAGTCCGCEEGGFSIAINARHVNRYNARRLRACPSDFHCTAEFLCPDGAVAYCNARHRCVYGVR